MDLELKTKKKGCGRPKTEHVAVEIELPLAIHDELMAILDGRGVTLSKFVEVYARSYLLSPSIFALRTRLPFKKYSGSTVEEIIRLDPSYVRFLMGNVQGFRLDELAQRLLDEVDPQ